MNGATPVENSMVALKKEIELGKSEINAKLNSYGITIDDINTALNYINDPSISKNVIINAIPDDILFHRWLYAISILLRFRL